MSSKIKTVRLHEEEIETQKNCKPGPNVVFPKGEVPFSLYLMHNKRQGSLGCPKDTFPKYINGKYCCETTPASNQEIFDYVNQLLENVITNVSDKQLSKQQKSIDYLLDYRNLYKSMKYLRLKDNLEVPPQYSSFEDWMEQTKYRLEQEDSEDRKTMAILASDTTVDKRQQLETLTQRVLLERDTPTRQSSVAKKNSPSKKPKSKKQRASRSRSSSRSSIEILVEILVEINWWKNT